MARHVLEVNSASIVLTGSFNPAIFQPEWFVRQNLMPAQEGEKAEIKVIAPQVCEFHTERFIIQVTGERFAAFSKPAANPAPLRDLVAGTFFILEHTPLKALGLNRDMHFALPSSSEDLWNRVGDTVAPKEIWRKVLHGHIGLRTLLLQAEIPDYPDKTQQQQRLNVRLEPSGSVKFGIFIQTNEHHEAPKESPSGYLIDRIRKRWEGAYSYAAEIADYILTATIS